MPIGHAGSAFAGAVRCSCSMRIQPQRATSPDADPESVRSRSRAVDRDRRTARHQSGANRTRAGASSSRSCWLATCGGRTQRATRATRDLVDRCANAKYDSETVAVPTRPSRPHAGSAECERTAQDVATCVLRGRRETPPHRILCRRVAWRFGVGHAAGAMFVGRGGRRSARRPWRTAPCRKASRRPARHGHRTACTRRPPCRSVCAVRSRWRRSVARFGVNDPAPRRGRT